MPAASLLAGRFSYRCLIFLETFSPILHNKPKDKYSERSAHRSIPDINADGEN
jgi:hypothetical protein